MLKLLVLIVLFPITNVEGVHSRPGEPENLRSVANRIGAALLASDWAKFRKDAMPYLVVEERWQAYEDYFSKGKQPTPSLGASNEKTIAFSTILKTASITAQDRRIFNAFCKWAKDARGYHSDGWGPWPNVKSGPGPHQFDTVKVIGPCIWGRVASNMDVVIGMERISGKWKANRLMVVGH